MNERPESSNEFDFSSITNEILEGRPPVNYEYFKTIYRLAQESSDETTRELLVLISRICEPNGVIQTEGKKTILTFTYTEYIDALDNVQLQSLQDILNSQQIIDPEIRARIAEVLVYKNFGNRYNNTQIAVDSLLDSANRLLQTLTTSFLFPDKKNRHNHEAFDRIERAVMLAKTMGVNNSILQNATSKIINTISPFINSAVIKFDLSINRYVLDVIRLAINEDFADAITLEPVIDTFIQNYAQILRNNTAINDFETYEITCIQYHVLLEIKAALYALINPANAKDITQLYTQAIVVLENRTVKQIQMGMINPGQANLNIGIILQYINNPSKRLKPLRQLGVLKDIRQHYQQLFLKYQRNIARDVGRIDSPFDRKVIQIKEEPNAHVYINRGIELATGRDVADVIAQLLNEDILPDVEAVIFKITPPDLQYPAMMSDAHGKAKGAEVLDQEKINRYIEIITLLNDSKTDSAQREDLIHKFLEEPPSIFYEKLAQEMNIKSRLITSAVQQLQKEHAEISFPLKFLSSDFVPSTNILIVEQANHFFIHGDMFTSVHLLVPQFETSLRHVLQQRGIIPKSLTEDEIQEKYTITKLLYEHSVDIDTIFGSHTALFLKGILTHRFGFNLRNRISHGLVYAQELEALWSYPPNVIAWWMFLKMNQTVATTQVTPDDLENRLLFKTSDEAPNKYIDNFIPFLKQFTSQFRPFSLGTLDPNDSNTFTQAKLAWESIGKSILNNLSAHMHQFKLDKFTFNAMKYQLESSSRIPREETAIDGIVDDRSEFWARALHFALQQEGAAFVHTVIPQIETMLRVELTKRDFLTVSFKDNIQEDYVLDTMFRNHYQDLENIFGADVMFNLKAILYDKDGLNLRNRMAHGLLTDEDCITPEIAYLWGLAMYLVFPPETR